MLLVPQTVAAASKLLFLRFGFPLLRVRSWSYSVLCCGIVLLFCLPHLRGEARLLFSFFLLCLSFFSFVLVFCFSCPFRFSLLSRHLDCCSICVSCLSYAVRWQVIALLSNLLAASQQQCSISAVSWFCDHRPHRPLSLYLSWKKNRHGHWVRWMSTARWFNVENAHQQYTQCPSCPS